MGYWVTNIIVIISIILTSTIIIIIVMIIWCPTVEVPGAPACTEDNMTTNRRQTTEPTIA